MLQLCRDRGEPRASGLLQRDGSDPASAAASLDDVVRNDVLRNDVRKSLATSAHFTNWSPVDRSERLSPFAFSGFYFLLTTVGEDQRTFLLPGAHLSCGVRL